jgi:uncharacterized membrane protein (DUF441 family)
MGGLGGKYMLLLSVSITLIAMLTSFVIYYTFRNKQRLTCMAGMMIAMTNAMMASIAVGTILGTLIQNKDLTIPTIVSVSIGMIVGYMTGRPISLMASIDGLTAGIMGGMMGSMLGVMLQPKSTDFMIYFIDVVYVAVIVLLIRLIDEEAKASKPEIQYKKPLVANPLILLGILLFMAVLVFGKGTLLLDTTQQSSNEVKEIKFTDTSNQIHEIIVNPAEYSPNNIEVKAGTPAILNFKTKEVGCTGIVLSDEIGFNVSLKPNTNNYVNMKSLKPGTYNYSCGMGMFKGTITAIN